MKTYRHMDVIRLPEPIKELALPYVFVVYSADRGIIITGYQVSGLRAVDVPEDAIWLR